MRKLALGIAVFTAIGMPTFAQHYDPDLGSRKYRPGWVVRQFELATWPISTRGGLWLVPPGPLDLVQHVLIV